MSPRTSGDEQRRESLRAITGQPNDRRAGGSGVIVQSRRKNRVSCGFREVVPEEHRWLARKALL